MSGILDDLKNAFRKRDNALMQLIVINIVVFVVLNVLHVTMWLLHVEPYYLLFENYLSLPASLPVLLFQPWTIITYFFVHKDFFHILFNLLFLYWFGTLIIEYLGSKRVISLYVLGGLVGGLTYIALYNLIPQFQDRVFNSQMIGASAGVYAIVVGAATLMPNYTFHLLFIGPVQIKYIAVFYIFMSYIGLRGANAGGDIAHLGGALIGYIFIIQLKRGTDLGKWITDLVEGIGGIFKKKNKMKVSYSKKSKVTANANYSTGKTGTGTTPNQDEIDAILDKISASGYESLTKEEKQKLFKASRD